MGRENMGEMDGAYLQIVLALILIVGLLVDPLAV